MIFLEDVVEGRLQQKTNSVPKTLLYATLVVYIDLKTKFQKGVHIHTSYLMKSKRLLIID